MEIITSNLDFTIENGRIEGELGRNVPLIVSYGIGTDSTAMLIGLSSFNVRPDAILFAHVGDEMPYTYQYLEIMNRFLISVGFPQVTIVQYTPQRFKYHRYATLAGNCLANRTLPSLAFGRKACSLKWKGEPLDRAVKLAYGETPVYRALGYDCSPTDNRRFAHAVERKGTKIRPHDRFVYPLHLWGWTRKECVEAIDSAGLPQPLKSSCSFCPAVKKHEVRPLPVPHLRRIVLLEANATPLLRTVKGLWRRSAITTFIREEGLLPAEEIDRIWHKWASPNRLIVDSQVQAEAVLDQECGKLYEHEIENYPLYRLAVKRPFIRMYESLLPPHQTSNPMINSLL